MSKIVSNWSTIVSLALVIAERIEGEDIRRTCVALSGSESRRGRERMGMYLSVSFVRRRLQDFGTESENRVEFGYQSIVKGN